MKTIFFLILNLFLLTNLNNIIAQQINSKCSCKPFTFPQGKTKAVILSYDDGLTQDRRFVQLLNKYGLVGTFNLNSGLFGKSAPWLKQFTGKEGKYITASELKDLYKNHEVASHTLTHPHLTNISNDEIRKEINTDIKLLKTFTKKDVMSFAYPFGDYNNEVISILKQAGITNARTVDDSHTFSIPNNFLVWNPTSHHSKAKQDIDQFLSDNSGKSMLLLIWGHSWEFDQNIENNNWKYIENLLKRLSNNKDIWYVGATEFVNYLQLANPPSKN